MQAGKDVYLEKPVSHNIFEGQKLIEASRKYDRIVQGGTQRRSFGRFRQAVKMLHDGLLGEIYLGKFVFPGNRDSIGFKPIEPVPNWLNWDLWLGPAQEEPFHANLVHYNWHWFWKTGNGDLNNQGTHELDVARWALDTDQTHPVRAMAIGGRFKWEDQGETPNTMFGIAEYPNGQQVFFNVRNVNFNGYPRQVENEYYFEDGGKIVRDKYYAKGSSKGEKLDIKPGKVTPGGNWGSFIAACRAGDPAMANGTAPDAHYGCVLGHLINNSYRLGTKVPFNAKAGKFGDNAAAHDHFMALHALMRDGVGVPEDKAEYVVGPWLSFDPKTERFVGEHADEANQLIKDPHNEDFQVPDAKDV
jgi:predicted dehydrogenase